MRGFPTWTWWDDRLESGLKWAFLQPTKRRGFGARPEKGGVGALDGGNLRSVTRSPRGIEGMDTENDLGGGVKYFLFSPLLGEMIQYD